MKDQHHDKNLMEGRTKNVSQLAHTHLAEKPAKGGTVGRIDIVSGQKRAKDGSGQRSEN